MMPRYSLTPVVIGLVVVAACGEGRGTPTKPGLPTASTSQVPTALRIEGPSSLAPGASAQYRAIASFADGRTQDVTSGASWLVHGDAGVLLAADRQLVAARGMVSGGTPGEADLTAYYPAGLDTADGLVFLGTGPLSSKIRILVLEPDTYRVSGQVTESGLPVPGVKVAVVAGERTGLSTHAKSDGTYVLYGLAGATDLAASEEAFQTATRSIVVTDHQTVDFTLQPLRGYDSLTGEWRLTLQASPSCGSQIPQDTTTRTFGARITQRGSQLTLDLTSPTRVILIDYPAAGFGGVSGADMGFYLQRDDTDQNPPRWVLLEMLEPRRFLGIAGKAEGQRSGNVMTGWFSGEFSVYRAAGPSYLAPGTVLESRCFRKIGEDSSLHTFRFERN